MNLYKKIFESFTVNRDVLASSSIDEWLFATDLADYLVTRGVPFREAHHVIGQMVRFCSDSNKKFTDFTLAELHEFSRKFDKGAMAVLRVEVSIKRRSTIGGTARNRVEKRLAVLKKSLQRELKL